MNILARPTTWLVLAIGLVGAVAWWRQPGTMSQTGIPAPAAEASNVVPRLTNVPPNPTPVAVAPPPAAAEPAIAPAPSFDIARVSPSGTAVLAGRAAPGASVTVRDGPAVLGQATADGRGEWVVVPDAAMSPGGRSLTLASRSPDGTEAAGTDTLVVLVPPRASPEPVVALAVPAQGPARVVQGPGAQPPGAQPLGLQTVGYNDQGAIRFAGTAPPGATLRLFIDNVPAGQATADAAGSWTMEPGAAVAEGVHTLRLDQIGATGVLARVELPFKRDRVMALAASDPASLSRVVVQPGQSLWQLARTAYGEGTRYTVIYTANQGQIRDPNLIYPGQAFALPSP